ncbi:MAG: hypothetical protein P4L84_16360 [Isosphaeraceae bacterium]|nr:hypothetical protein [Isosphaeraceae bacterium]
MPDPAERTLTKETLVRIAREQSGLEIKEGQAADLAKTVNGLQAEAQAAYALARPADEPATLFVLEEWTND